MEQANGDRNGDNCIKCPNTDRKRCDLDCYSGFECAWTAETENECLKKACRPKKSSCILNCATGAECAFAQRANGKGPFQFKKGIREPGAFYLGVHTSISDEPYCNTDCGSKKLDWNMPNY